MSLEQFIKDELDPEMSLCCECGVIDVGQWDMSNNCWYCELCWKVFLHEHPPVKRKRKKLGKHPDPFVKSSMREGDWYQRRLVAIANTVKSEWGIDISDLLIQEIFSFCFDEQGLSLQWTGQITDPGAIILDFRSHLFHRTQFLVSFAKPTTILRLNMVWHVTRNLKPNLPSYKIPLAKHVKFEARFDKGSKRARKVWIVLWQGVPQTDWKQLQHDQFNASIEANFFPPMMSVSVLRITCPPKLTTEELEVEANLERHLKYVTLAMVST